MSVVTVKDLVPGDLATSADANSTLTSWNDAAGAADIGANNVRVEGVTRRSIDSSGDVIEMEHSAYFENYSTSGAVTSAALAVVPLNLGVDPMQTPVSVTAPSNGRILVHAALALTSAPLAATVNLPMVTMEVQRSTDAGATWTSLTGSRRRFAMRQTDALCDPTPGNAVPGCIYTVGWCQYDAPQNAATLWRVAYLTVNGSFTFNWGVISVEVLLR